MKNNHHLSTVLYCVLSLSSLQAATLYEDAEQHGVQSNIQNPTRTVDGWYVYDNTPSGAAVHSVYDTIKQSHVIQFAGASGNVNGYVIGDWTPTSPGSWNNTSEFNVNWCSRYANNFVVYMRVYVANPVTYTHPNGNNYTTYQRYLYYTAANTSQGVSGSYPYYIHFGLGTDKQNGQWHSIHRDLLADLQQHEPGNTITSVTAFLIRANGKVDDIYLSQNPLKPVISLKKTISTVYDPVNGITNPKAIPGSILEYTLKASNTGYKSADNNTILLQDSIPANMKTCVANIGQCKKPYLNTSNNSSGMTLGTVSYIVNGVETTNPPADADGFNSDVTKIKIAMNGEFPNVCGGPQSFEVKFRASVQ